MTDRIAIVGAGIAGLTAALALARSGAEITLLERRTAFSESGAGIQLSPNATRILFELGLSAALRRAASEPDRVLVRSESTGREIGSVALGAFMRETFGAPYLVIHRADLQTILLDAVRARPNIRLLMGRRAVAMSNGASEAALTVETAGGASAEIAARLIVGADGVWSDLRRLSGDRREPVYHGYVAWRATLPRDMAPEELSGNETGLWLGRDGHVVHYPISEGRLINIVAVRRRATPVEGWSEPGDPAEFLAGSARSAPVLRQLLAAASGWHLRSLFDLPVRTMGSGRLALVGDAAHPVLPFLAQGGALAIEDAAVLARMIERSPQDVEKGVAAYARARRSRVRRVQSEARKNGGLFHASGAKALLRDVVLRRTSAERAARRYAWIYGWSPPARTSA